MENNEIIAEIYPEENDDEKSTASNSPDDNSDIWPDLLDAENIIKTLKPSVQKKIADGELVLGKLSMTRHGYGFVIPESKGEDENDIFIDEANLNTAMNGDTVLVRCSKLRKGGRSDDGVITRVLKRANVRVVGTLRLSPWANYLRPDDKKIFHDILVTNGTYQGAADAMKAVVEIKRWPDFEHGPEGRIVEVLGWLDDVGVDILSIMYRCGLKQEFPAEAAEAAKKIPQTVLPDEISEKGRIDRRDFTTVTIDGDDSKDFDDAVYAERRPDGWFLGVYIADVSHYVKEYSLLDDEALKRGNSAYLVGCVVPMLPFELSNGICSLNEGVDRLVVACEMMIDKNGIVTSYNIAPAVIKSHHRLTYGLVNQILVDQDEALAAKYADVLEMLRILAEIRGALKQMRLKRGAIEFDLPEVKIKLDEDGRPIEVSRRTATLADSIIEECMVAANETVAKHLKMNGEPCIYRVHEMPGAEKIENLNLLLAAFGFRVNVNPLDGTIEPGDVASVLAKVKGTLPEKIINTITLRSMQQARYSPSCLGHFGIAAKYYAHFTSPIRRYADLIVHRRLKEFLQNGKTTAAKQEKILPRLEKISAHISHTERNAADAERETVKLKAAEYMAQFIGQTFSGNISGVTDFGIFVELANGIEGLAHINRMKDDVYEYFAKQYAVIGKDSGRKFTLGDPVEVILARASIEEKQIDFIIKEDESAAERKQKAEKAAKEKKPKKLAHPPKKPKKKRK